MNNPVSPSLERSKAHIESMRTLITSFKHARWWSCQPPAQVLLSPTDPPRCMLIMALYWYNELYTAIRVLCSVLILQLFVLVTRVVKLVLHIQYLKFNLFGQLELYNIQYIYSYLQKGSAHWCPMQEFKVKATFSVTQILYVMKVKGHALGLTSGFLISFDTYVLFSC